MTETQRRALERKVYRWGAQDALDVASYIVELGHIPVRNGSKVGYIMDTNGQTVFVPIAAIHGTSMKPLIEVLETEDEVTGG